MAVKRKKKVSEPFVPERTIKVEAIIAVPPLYSGPICETCKEPAAPGQSSVCLKHMRVG